MRGPWYRATAIVVRTGALGLSCILALAGCGESTGPERELSGQRLYEQYCARCHGPTGRPEDPQTQTRDLSDARIVDTISDERMMGVIRSGIPSGCNKPGRPPCQMPPFAEHFTDAALLVLVAYVRSLSGSQGKRGRPADGS